MASGKSTISSKLEKKLKNYVLVDRAYLKDTVLSKVKARERELALKLSKDAMFFIAKRLMKRKYNIILQEIRVPSVKKYLKKEIKEYKYRIKSVHLYCSLEESKRRDSIRQKRYIRPKLVEDLHRKYASSDPEDFIINTEKNSINNSS